MVIGWLVPALPLSNALVHADVDGTAHRSYLLAS